MPELPEVETTRRGIAPHIVGKKVRQVVIRNPQLRWPIPAELATHIVQNTLRSIERRGKYLLLHFDEGTALWHLGMSGSLRIVTANTTPGKHDHVDWVFSSKHVLRFNDPRRFGALLWTTQDPRQHNLLKQLGPEPLTAEFNADYVYQKSRKRTQAIKTWLMDSKVVVGVGNIYANEALFASGISPSKPAHKLSKAKGELLVQHVQRILSAAILRGGTTLRDFVGSDGKPGYFAQELLVYGRGNLPCKICGKILVESRLGQRSTVFCRHCQK